MGLGIIPIEPLAALVDGIAVALDRPRGEVQVFPHLQRNIIAERNDARQLGKCSGVPNNDQCRVTDGRMALLERIDELLEAGRSGNITQQPALDLGSGAVTGQLFEGASCLQRHD